MVRLDARSKESVHVSEWDVVSRNEIDTNVEAAKIAVPSISAELQSKQYS